MSTLLEFMSSRTFVVLEVSPEAHDEIKRKLEEAGYNHALVGGGDDILIDMHGIMLRRRAEEESA